MTLLTTWPTIADDSGDLQSGTVLDASNLGTGNNAQTMKAAIEAQLHSAGNPTITPASITDEVVTARGSKASLDARLDVALNEDGTPKAQAGVALVTQLQDAFGTANWFANDDMKLWSGGDSAAPDYWVHDGTGGGTVAREATTIKFAEYSAKLVFGATLNSLYQIAVPAGGAWTRLGPLLKGKAFGFGFWVKASTANQVRAYAYDGAATYQGDYHTGDGTWQFLTVSDVVSNSGTQLLAGIKIVAGAAFPVYAQGAVLFFGPAAPSAWFPCRTLSGVIHFVKTGTIATGTLVAAFNPLKPGRVEHVQLSLETAPTGADFKVDVNTWDLSAFTTMFTTKPTIVATAKLGGAVPDGTYARRCFSKLLNTARLAGDRISFDVDQVGSSVAGADLIVEVRTIQYLRPQEQYLDYTDL